MYACLNKAEIDSLCVSSHEDIATSCSPVVRSSDGLGEHRGDVNVIDLALGRLYPLGLVNRVGDDKLLDGQIPQIVHGRLGKKAWDEFESEYVSVACSP